MHACTHACSTHAWKEGSCFMHARTEGGPPYPALVASPPFSQAAQAWKEVLGMHACIAPTHVGMYLCMDSTSRRMHACMHALRVRLPCAGREASPPPSGSA